VRLVARWAIWFVALWWLWMLLVGEWNPVEWVAATAAAAVSASLFELMRARAGVEARVPFEWIARAASVPKQIFVDFGIVTVALLRRRSGVFRAHEFPATGSSSTDVGIRAWADYAANFSPNALAVDIDREHGLSLVHDLVPNRDSELPA
jgi:hypothetical protein